MAEIQTVFLNTIQKDQKDQDQKDQKDQKDRKDQKISIQIVPEHIAYQETNLETNQEREQKHSEIAHRSVYIMKFGKISMILFFGVIISSFIILVLFWNKELVIFCKVWLIIIDLCFLVSIINNKKICGYRVNICKHPPLLNMFLLIWILVGVCGLSDGSNKSVIYRFNMSVIILLCVFGLLLISCMCLHCLLTCMERTNNIVANWLQEMLQDDVIITYNNFPSRNLSARPLIPPVLSNEEINKIPTKKYSSEYNVDNCCICLGKYKIKDEVKQLLCSEKHIFHKKCIDRWLSEYGSSCPICRVIPGRETVY